MAHIHFLCRNRANLRCVDPATRAYDSGDWDLTGEQAAQLIGGTLYLHNAKSERAYFGGKVTDFRITEIGTARSKRIIFTFVSEAERKGASWPAVSNHPRAFTTGIIAP